MARILKQSLASTCPKGTTIVNCSNSIIEMHPRVVLRGENVPRGPELVNRSLKADCTNFTDLYNLCKTMLEPAHLKISVKKGKKDGGPKLHLVMSCSF